MSRLPLEGVRIVDITLVWVGPFATQMLADWGAEVIRVEPLQVFQPMTRGNEARPKKGSRYYGDAFPDNDPGDRPWNRHVAFQIHGRNKLSMTSDLEDPDCMDAFLRLVSISDVVLENNVPSTMKKLGVSYDLLKTVRPDLVMVRVPAFGITGPYAGFRALGNHMEAAAGMAHIRGYRDYDPTLKDTTYISDSVGGISAAYGTMAALTHRDLTGEGQLVEVPTAESTIHYLSEAMMDYQMNDRMQSPIGNMDTSMAPHGCYPCRGEDNWVVIAVGSDAEWEGLRKAMGGPEWAGNKAFSTILGRYNNQDLLNDHISQWTREQEHIELMHLLQKHGVPAAAVHDQKELFEDPHMRHRGFFEEVTQPATGTHKYCGMMWKMEDTPNHIRLPSPMLGEHNEWVYRDLLGTPDQKYRQLEDAGHIGMDYPPHVG